MPFTWSKWYQFITVIKSWYVDFKMPLTSYCKHSHETSLLIIYASVSDFCCMTMWQYTRSKSICFWIWHWGEIPVYSLRLEVCLFSVTWPRAHKIEKQSLTKEDHSVWVTRLPGPISKSILTVRSQRNVNKGNDEHENRPSDTCRISQSTISKPVAGVHDFGNKPLLLGDTY